MEPHRPFRWVAFIVTLVVAAAVAFFAYNAGVAHGVATAGQQLAAPAPGALPPYAFYRPWGFGFPFFFGPFFFFLLFVLVMRGLFWGSRWRRYGCAGGYYGGGPMTFDDWHRRAHERMAKDASGPPRDDDRPRG